MELEPPITSLSGIIGYWRCSGKSTDWLKQWRWFFNNNAGQSESHHVLKFSGVLFRQYIFYSVSLLQLQFPHGLVQTWYLPSHVKHFVTNSFPTNFYWRACQRIWASEHHIPIVVFFWITSFQQTNNARRQHYRDNPGIIDRPNKKLLGYSHVRDYAEGSALQSVVGKDSWLELRGWWNIIPDEPKRWGHNSKSAKESGCWLDILIHAVACCKAQNRSTAGKLVRFRVVLEGIENTVLQDWTIWYVEKTAKHDDHMPFLWYSCPWLWLMSKHGTPEDHGISERTISNIGGLSDHRIHSDTHLSGQPGVVMVSVRYWLPTVTKGFLFILASKDSGVNKNIISVFMVNCHGFTINFGRNSGEQAATAMSQDSLVDCFFVGIFVPKGMPS